MFVEKGHEITVQNGLHALTVNWANQPSDFTNGCAKFYRRIGVVLMVTAFDEHTISLIFDLVEHKIVAADTLIAVHDHEWLLDRLIDYIAVFETVHIGTSLATTVLCANFTGCGPAERVPKEANMVQVQPSREQAGPFTAVQAFQLI